MILCHITLWFAVRGLRHRLSQLTACAHEAAWGNAQTTCQAVKEQLPRVHTCMQTTLFLYTFQVHIVVVTLRMITTSGRTLGRFDKAGCPIGFLDAVVIRLSVYLPRKKCVGDRHETHPAFIRGRGLDSAGIDDTQEQHRQIQCAQNIADVLLIGSTHRNKALDQSAGDTNGCKTTFTTVSLNRSHVLSTAGQDYTEVHREGDRAKCSQKLCKRPRSCRQSARQTVST
jgi:hypothetical protein